MRKLRVCPGHRIHQEHARQKRPLLRKVENEDETIAPRTLSETDMVHRWLLANAGESPRWERVRLGLVEDPYESGVMAVLQRWADAIVDINGQIIIIEAKLNPEPGAVGQLEFYARQFRKTPMFKKYWENPIGLVFLSGREDYEIRQWCAEKDILFVVYDLE